MIKTVFFHRFLRVLFALVVLQNIANAAGKTIYVHLLDGDDSTADGSYSHPFKSWREALRQVTGGDTIVAKNGDYRKAGRGAKWGGLDFVLTLADALEKGDPHPVQSARADAVGIYRYSPEHPLTIRAETRHGVILDHIRFHLASGIVIDGFDIFPNPYYTDSAGQKLNRRRNGIHYECPPGGCTPAYDPLQDDDRLYLIKFNQSHHITIEDNDLFDGKNYQRKPAIDLPCSDDVVVRRNLIRNSHRGVVSKGGGKRVLIEANVFVDNSGAAFSGGSTDPNLFIDGRYGDPCSFAFYESYDMTARDNLVVSTRPGERPLEPISIWSARNAVVVNNTFVGTGERGVLLIRPGNEVDNPAKGCGRSVRLTRTDDLSVKKNVFILSGVVDETMLYQITGEGVKIAGFQHSDNTFFNAGHEVPIGGLADPNREPGFSEDDPRLMGGLGTDYSTWMGTARPRNNPSSRGRGVRHRAVSEEAPREHK